MSEWPTLELRLKHAITSELVALQQLSRTCELTDYAKKRMAKLLEKEKKKGIKNE